MNNHKGQLMLKKFKTNILVRDKMVEKMKADGILVNFEKLNKEKYIESLRKKIIEEANELAEERDREKLIYEFADLTEVMQTLADAVGITESEILEARKKKNEKSGALKEGYFTNFVEIDSGNPVIEYYLARPKKYPEIA